jgi:hypothetical protein
MSISTFANFSKVFKKVAIPNGFYYSREAMYGRAARQSGFNPQLKLCGYQLSRLVLVIPYTLLVG